jgi:CheY-like chemotaxis protein
LGRGTSFEVRLWLRAINSITVPEYSEEAVVTRTPSRYTDTRVLVVDDQAFNCELAESLLSAVGIKVDVVYNGLEALERIRGQGIYVEGLQPVYDMVLMDVQMPVMDGLSATRALRESEKFASLPVIAMTAHTMVHEKETTRAAGMSDHLGKPFELDDFYRLLERWIPAHKRINMASENSRKQGSTSVSNIPKKLMEVDGLDATAGLARIGGNATRYHHWLKDFFVSGPQFVEQLRAAQQQNALLSMIDSLHAFKGRVGLLGMTRLHEQLANLENALEQSMESKESCGAYDHAHAIGEIGLTVTALCAAIRECLQDTVSDGEAA